MIVKKKARKTKPVTCLVIPKEVVIGRRIFITVLACAFFLVMALSAVVTAYVYQLKAMGPLANVSYKKLGESSALVSWKTKFPAKVRLEYGTSTIYPNSKLVTDAYAMEGSELFTTLLPGKKHFFRVVAEDQRGRIHTSHFFDIN